eukprot:1496177-Rhodomonas_salina.2
MQETAFLVRIALKTRFLVLGFGAKHRQLATCAVKSLVFLHFVSALAVKRTRALSTGLCVADTEAGSTARISLVVLPCTSTAPGTARRQYSASRTGSLGLYAVCSTELAYGAIQYAYCYCWYVPSVPGIA